MKASTAPTQVTVSLLAEPYGVDRNTLTFAFAMQAGGRGRTMTGYRLAFAATPAQLAAEDFVLDTGMVSGSCSCGITVPGLGERLQPDTLYYLQVQTRDDRDRVSEWSAPTAFFTAPEDWRPATCWAAGQPDLCLLRHVFTLNETPVKAFVQVTAASPEPMRQYVYQLACNGASVCAGPTRLDRRQGQTVQYFETVDVTGFLRPGKNCLSAVCCAGAEHRFACRLLTVNAAGQTTCHAATPAGWQAMDATPLFRPSASIGTQYYAAPAENIDGTLWPTGFELADFAGAGFTAAADTGAFASDRLLPYPAPAMRARPVSATAEEVEEGVYVADLGREIVGAAELAVTLAQPTDVTVRYGEELTEEGRVRYRMRTGNVYEEHWRLPAGASRLRGYGMKTFRYVEVEGLPCEMPDDMVKGLALRTPFREEDSYFTGASELLGAIYDMCKYTVKATNQNLYVDSQSRERCAYEGDVLINMLTAAAVTDANALTRFSLAYLLNHRTWPAEYVLFCPVMARLDYDYTGDKTLLAQAYDALCGMHYWRCYDPAVGLLKNPTMAGNVTDAVLVDWPGSERDGYAYNQAVYNTVFNAVQVRSLQDLAYLAAALHKTEDAARFAAMANDLKNAMIDRLYNEETGAFRDGLTETGEPVDHYAQHATAFALYAGVHNSPAMAGRMAAFLADQGAIRTSVYGAFFLLEGLYAADRDDAANALLLSDDISEGARTWAYMVDRLQATITTEAWNPANKGNMTFSHPWGSAAGNQIVRGLFGIQPLTPGFADFSVRLHPAGLRYAALQTPTVKGPILAAYDTTRPNCPLALTLRVPANATAHVSVAAPVGLTVQEAADPVNARYCEQTGRYEWQAGSGEWMFELR